MHMVPPAVEREVDGKTGAAIMWLESTTSVKQRGGKVPTAPVFSRPIRMMQMFDNLIGNIDRNAGNILIGAPGELILIDHSRAFIDKKDLKGIAPLGRVDRKLWEKMQALTLEDLDRILGKWTGDKEKKALITRRDLMAKNIAELVKKHGEKFVFYDDFQKTASQ